MQKILLLFFFSIFANSFAQDSLKIGNFEPQKNAPIIKAIQTKESISIDGKLDESAWKNAPVTSDFFMIEPRQGGKVNSPSLVLNFRKKFPSRCLSFLWDA